MATITLICIIYGESTPFPVHIDKTLLVDDLKKEIKKQKENDFRNIDADKLTLWNVDISDDDEAAIRQLALQADTANETMMRPARKISRYFVNEPTEEHIHVVIERPPGK
jgi:Crinkler effector protein N-terminal domain